MEGYVKIANDFVGNKKIGAAAAGLLVEFCYYLEKLHPFDEAAQHLRALDGWRCPECDTVNADDIPVCECGYSKSRRK